MLPDYIKKLAAEQRAIRRNQPHVTSEEARRQFLRVQGVAPEYQERVTPSTSEVRFHGKLYGTKTHHD